LHRGRVFGELLAFCVEHKPCVKTANIQIEMIMPNGMPEFGEDVGGVFRDAVSEFWETFHSAYTVGNRIKVPALVHTMTQERWKAVAVVIALGFSQSTFQWKLHSLSGTRV
jgi:hypothetical protein